MVTTDVRLRAIHCPPHLQMGWLDAMWPPSALHHNQGGAIAFDLSRCERIDPEALMLLLGHLAGLRESGTVTVEVVLPASKGLRRALKRWLFLPALADIVGRPIPEITAGKVITELPRTITDEIALYWPISSPASDSARNAQMLGPPRSL